MRRALTSPSAGGVFARTATLAATSSSSSHTQSRRRPISTAAPKVAKGSFLKPLDTFMRRHIGPNPDEVKEMLARCQVKSVEELISQTLPVDVALQSLPVTGNAAEVPESVALEEIRAIAKKNKVLRSFIGMGYNDTITPPVILRNIVENPAWYTPYTPYQAEVSQGRMESLLNFQTMVCELTGLDVANASLLDEGTAAAEAMTICRSANKKKDKKIFVVAHGVHPQTLAVVRTRAEPYDVEVVVGDHETVDLSEACGILVQYPTTDGRLIDYTSLSARAHSHGARVVIATDLLACTVAKSPGEMGADIALGNSQRFGVPLGYGGPHAAFFAVRKADMRLMPGRLIGVTVDANGDRALRLALQTREQHIKREKATSNICTAQALLANVAAMYGVYHGPNGLREIALRVNAYAKSLAVGLERMGHKVATKDFFDTVRVNFASPKDADAAVASALAVGINIRRLLPRDSLSPEESKKDPAAVSIALDETVSEADLTALFSAFSGSSGYPGFSPKSLEGEIEIGLPTPFVRKSPFMTQAVFNTYETETEMMRYIFHLASKDVGLVHSMISLGSCTMKLNAAAEMIPITWPEFNRMHPFCPIDQAAGYAELTSSLSNWLCALTGFTACSLQPNSGSAGEYAGLMAIRAYHKSRNDAKRNICVIPVSAHGTNPASATLAAMTVVGTPCDSDGNIDTGKLRAVCEQHRDNLACIMITYPSTHGVFETNIREIVDLVHSNGGLVYMDGANFNAQVGITSPGEIGADVCHLNLHKTFCIPHGGGGPGMGPICVNSKLAPFLSDHPIVSCSASKETSVGAVSAAPWGSASILPISWMYIRMMGAQGLKTATMIAVLNANYMKERLREHYSILYANKNGRVAHEFIVDLRGLTEASKQSDPDKKSGITETDIAKRLQDFGFHAPTMSFPVPGTLMIEPTESEPKPELDRFIGAMIIIRREIQDVIEGKADPKDNPLKKAPHTQKMVCADTWNHKYTREQAAYPLDYLRENKFWPTVGRADDVFGDRNLFCTCDPVQFGKD